MRDRWTGLEAGVDAGNWARLLRRAHDVALRSGRTPSIVRDVIAQSWDRSKAAGVDAGEPGAPMMIEPEDARDRWDEHPLSRTTEILRSVLGNLLFDARHIAVVSDAEGCLLWADGHPDVLKASEAIRFSPGHAWSEAAAGTNAVGTALAADHAVQVFSAEHYRSEVHGWQCSAAPIHDPESGEILGVIDVTGSYRTAHPSNLALVQMAARLVEERLRGEMLARDNRILGMFAEHTARHDGPAAAVSHTGRILAATPHAWTSGRIELSIEQASGRLSDGTKVSAHPLGEGVLLWPAESGSPRGRHAVTHHLTLLGANRALLRGPAGSRRLTARHSEIVTLLALHRDGLDSHELAELMYGEPGHEVSARAELHRLRVILGSRLVTRPYRLEGVEIDLELVNGLLARGRTDKARARCGGPLLPPSSVPEIVSARENLACRLGAAPVAV